MSTHPSHISDRSDKVLHQSIQVVYIDQVTKGTRFMIYFKDGGVKLPGEDRIGLMTEKHTNPPAISQSYLMSYFMSSLHSGYKTGNALI